MGKRSAVIYTPHRWLPRAVRRAQRVLPMTNDYPPEVWGFSTRLYHTKTIEFLGELHQVSTDGPEWWKWIVYSGRLEATCGELGVAKLDREAAQEAKRER